MAEIKASSAPFVVRLNGIGLRGRREHRSNFYCLCTAFARVSLDRDAVLLKRLSIVRTRLRCFFRFDLSQTSKGRWLTLLNV